MSIECRRNLTATRPISRRQLLQRSGGGFGALALAALLAEAPVSAIAGPGSNPADPLAERRQRGRAELIEQISELVARWGFEVFPLERRLVIEHRATKRAG